MYDTIYKPMYGYVRLINDLTFYRKYSMLK
jgi:hypothetical protein